MTFPFVVLLRIGRTWSVQGPVFDTAEQADERAEYLVRSGQYSRTCVETWSAGSAEHHVADLNSMSRWDHITYQFKRWLNGPVPALGGGTLPRGIAYIMTILVVIAVLFNVLK